MGWALGLQAAEPGLIPSTPYGPKFCKKVIPECRALNSAKYGSSPSNESKERVMWYFIDPRELGNRKRTVGSKSAEVHNWFMGTF